MDEGRAIPLADDFPSQALLDLAIVALHQGRYKQGEEFARSSIDAIHWYKPEDPCTATMRLIHDIQEQQKLRNDKPLSLESLFRSRVVCGYTQF